MNTVLTFAGILSFIVASLAALTIIFVVACTDVHERFKQWLLHKVWW